MKFLENIKKAYKNFLRYLIESNKKNLGNKKMDCCNLNRKESGRKVSEKLN